MLTINALIHRFHKISQIVNYVLGNKPTINVCRHRGNIFADIVADSHYVLIKLIHCGNLQTPNCLFTKGSDY